ncbi:MAG: polysaccharide deacetylase family protein [Terrimicrobiaceae bacterium]|nr:polysaccharide deacetylase family protein [Terrimicrobiaceae bacterium]
MGLTILAVSAGAARAEEIIGGSLGDALPVSGRQVAFIFEDGPRQESTPRILDALRSAGARATFSLVGKQVDAFPELARRIHAEGHEIAIRTYSNTALGLLTEEQIRSEIVASRDAVVRATGIQPLHFRPPQGEVTPRIVAIAESHGLRILVHSFDSGDWRNPPPGRMTRTILDGVTPGALILAHESFPRAVVEIPVILAELGRRGFESRSVMELRRLTNDPVVLSSLGSGGRD